MLLLDGSLLLSTIPDTIPRRGYLEHIEMMYRKWCVAILSTGSSECLLILHIHLCYRTLLYLSACLTALVFNVNHIVVLNGKFQFDR